MDRTLAHRMAARALLLATLAVASFAAVAVAATINGTGGPDILVGTSANDTINGFGGDDALFGNQGIDNVQGHTGDDLIHGGSGSDRLFGDEGADTIFGDGNNALCPAGVTSLNYCSFTPSGSGSGDDNINGGDGDDDLHGGAGNDQIDGDAGDDTIDGDSGNDALTGGSGEDFVIGGAGNDTINVVDGEFDRFSCGGGTDSVKADLIDQNVGNQCEKVSRR